jgi:predicted naringenin-chalcone synthase
VTPRTKKREPVWTWELQDLDVVHLRRELRSPVTRPEDVGMVMVLTTLGRIAPTRLKLAARAAVKALNAAERKKR